MKKIAWILFILNSLIWAKNECKFEIKSLESEVSEVYNKDKLTTVKSSCQRFKNEDLTVVVTKFTDKEYSHTKSLWVISLFDTKQHKRIVSKEIISSSKKLLWVEDIVIYPFYRFSITFTVSRKLDAYGSRVELFLYEFKEDKLHTLLSNFMVQDEVIDVDFESFESIFTYKLKENSLKKEGHPPLVFNREYKFVYSNEFDDKHPIYQEWKVNFDFVLLVYNMDRRAYQQITKEKPLFDLKQVEKNTLDGLKYREIVLRAMLNEVPLNKENVEIYHAISVHLKANGHKKEGNFLAEQILGAFPERKSLAQVEVPKIKKSNKSYQVYQELNKYDIFLMLVTSSNYIKSWRKHTDLKYFHLIEADMRDGVISSMVYIDKEGRGFAEDEPASLGVIAQFDYNVKTKKLIETITDNKDLRQQNFNSEWADIMDIYLFNKKREYLFVKEKSYLYKKPNSENKSKKFLIKDDCALILDKTSDGWYKVFYYHYKLHTNIIMWLKFDAEKHFLIGV